MSIDINTKAVIVDTLPNKPSELLKLALSDLKKVERSKKYFVDMETYHSKYSGDNVCSVCLAGSVMAKSLNVPIDTSYFSIDWDVNQGIQSKLKALDNFRSGGIVAGLTKLGIKKPHGLPYYFQVETYEKNKRSWYKSMREIVDVLEYHGL